MWNEKLITYECLMQTHRGLEVQKKITLQADIDVVESKTPKVSINVILRLTYPQMSEMDHIYYHS